MTYYIPRSTLKYVVGLYNPTSGADVNSWSKLTR